ncbi:TPA: hypothetical protein DDZ86_01730 [Candidatus Dependentiae bacterium]|nr:MAG: hypothetical protein UW09_C0001G0291 [candidate division TM6 bacterium GW2011_GWF2_43_87]HBL98344.1 hypothetical protein [Candidatus Dependentiae bacterium]
MNKYFVITLALLSSSGYMLGVGSFPIEIRNDRPELHVKIVGGGLVPGGVDFSDTAGGNLGLKYMTIETVPQNAGDIVSRDYTMFVSKKQGPGRPVAAETPIKFQFYGAPGNWGVYQMTNEKVNQDAMIAYLDGKRVYYPGWWGQGVTPQIVNTYWLQDGTKFEVVLELVFESGWRKLKVYIR